MADALPFAAQPQSARERDIIGWGKEAIEEGQAFVKSQPHYSKIQPTIDAIMDTEEAIRGTWLSVTRANQIGKIAGDLAALLTDTKPFWSYQTNNSRFEKQGTILGKLSTHWYLQRQIDVRMAELVKYYSVAGTSFAHMFWDTDMGDINISAEDPRDVLPVRPGSYLTIQDAMGVLLRRERTVNYLRRRYPEKAKYITPDRDGSSQSALAGSRYKRLMDTLGFSVFWDAMAQFGVARKIPRIPTADVYTLYVSDDRRNETGQRHPVGDFDRDGKPMNSWSYWVEPGQEMWPRKRCIVFTNTAVLYDGPSKYWHGKFPFIKYTLEHYPWTWLGKAPLWDLLPLQHSLNSLLRIVDDHMAKVARPDVIADKRTSRASLEGIDTRRAGLKLYQNTLGAVGSGIQLVYPPALPGEVFKQIEWNVDQMEKLSGVRDMSQLMKLNQIPSSDTIDRMTELMTPLVRMRSRMFEAFMREFAEMLMYNFAQFYTLPMKLRILGASSITPQDDDFDPGTFIPDFVHDGDFDRRGILKSEAFMRGPLPRYDRANEFLRQFTFNVMPGSLLSASAIERKLQYLQFARAGLIDHWTLLQEWGIPNVGNPPDGYDTITERLQAEQQLGLGMAISAAGRKATGQELPRVAIKES